MRSPGRAARRLAIISRISLPVSAQECAASATIDADPLNAAATDLAIAMSMFAAKASNTVKTLSFSFTVRFSRG